MGWVHKGLKHFEWGSYHSRIIIKRFIKKRDFGIEDFENRAGIKDFGRSFTWIEMICVQRKNGSEN